MYLLTQNSLVFENRWRVDWDRVKSVKLLICRPFWIFSKKVFLLVCKVSIDLLHMLFELVMANFALAAMLNISANMNCLDTLQAIFDLAWSRLQKYIMKSVLTIIAHGMTIQTLTIQHLFDLKFKNCVCNEV
jgi:hypothetical protein